MYATSINKITKLSVLSIGISINISFHRHWYYELIALRDIAYVQKV